jgi:putative phage-type endonuclease
MKKDLQIFHIPYGTDEWYKFRQERGIGGSECGTVLGINKYDTSIRLYHEKIGTIEPRKDDNERMFFGRINEDTIAKVWQYYDGTKDGYIENYKNDKIIRKCRNVNGYIVNPKYPWLFISVDRLINIDGGFNLITGEPLTTEGVLECKAMGYWSSKMWENGMPDSYLAQIHQYMAVMETDYAEIAMLVDGGDFRVEKVQRDDLLTERILSITKRFWYDRVLPAREALKKRDLADAEGNIEESEKNDTVIQYCEPDPDYSEAYNDFMEEKFVKERETITGTVELFQLARQDNFLRSLKTKIDKERTRIKNVFVKFLSDNSSEGVDFGNLGYVNWSLKKGSKNRVYNNKTKEKPSENYIDQEYEKLDLNGFK